MGLNKLGVRGIRDEKEQGCKAKEEQCIERNYIVQRRQTGSLKCSLE